MRIVITGATGTLGKELLSQLESNDITVISRDELKQQELKKKYPLVKFIIGDIRNFETMRQALCKVRPDVVYHAAALKHVDVVEENVHEGMLTNYMGVVNTHRAAREAGCKVMALSSTDKAVLPINAYGYSKGLAEKYLFSTSDHDLTNVVYRYGNVLGSRGSVIHAFAKTLKEQGKVFLTHKDMTRFWIPIEKAVGFMIDCTMNIYNGQSNIEELKKPLIPEIRALPVIDIAMIVAECVGVSDYIVEQVGLRPGEKIHELLYSSHEYCISSEKAEQCNRDEIKEYIKGILDV